MLSFDSKSGEKQKKHTTTTTAKRRFFGKHCWPTDILFSKLVVDMTLVVPLGRRLLARIGAEIGTYDRLGEIGPPNRCENDDRGGGGDLHRSASFRPPKPEPSNRDKFQKPSGMACSRFPNFLGDFCEFVISAWSAMMKIFEGDGADRAGVIGLIRQGFARVGLEAVQPDRDRVSSDQGFLIGRSGRNRAEQGQLKRP